MKFTLHHIFMIVVAALMSSCSGGFTSSDDTSSTERVPGSYSTVSTLAGTHYSQGVVDGTGTNAKFFAPNSAVVVGDSMYVTEVTSATIRKIVLSTGEVTTFAGTPGIYGISDGIGAAAEFNSPEGIATDGTSLFVTDSGSATIRKISIATAEVTTFAGMANTPGTADGTGTSAQFTTPSGIATDGTFLYVVDTGAHTVRKIEIASATVGTFLGSAGVDDDDDGVMTAARFKSPMHIAYTAGQLYITDQGNNLIRQADITTGAVTTLAGSTGVATDTNGTGTAAAFNSPYAITTDGTNLYVTDNNRSVIRKIVIATGEVTTPYGAFGSSSYVDGTGNITRFNSPRGAVYDNGNLYVIDTSNNAIRKIVISSGTVSTLAGIGWPSETSTNGTGSKASFNRPDSMVAVGNYLYVVDTLSSCIRRVLISTTVVSTFAGTCGTTGSTNGIGTSALFSNPSGIAADNTYLYVSDTGNHTIRRISIASGSVTTYAGTAGVAGTTDDTGTAASFTSPKGLVLHAGYLYVAGDHAVRRIAISDATVTTVAGLKGTSGLVNDTGTAARFNNVVGLTVIGSYIYTVESGNHMVRKIEIATGTVSDVAGDAAGVSGFANGTGAAARFDLPKSITTDGTYLYVADYNNGLIRKIVPGTGEVTTLAGNYNSLIVEGDRDGTIAYSRFHSPNAIVYTSNGLFVANDYAIRKIY